MQLSAISLALTRAGYSIFTPSSIFTTGVNGVWYDPSDYSTLYRDAAGTLPVTAVEQPVGLMLDKSKGLVLGPELVTNGAFDTNVTGWIAMQNATISWSGGRGRATGDGVNAYPGIQQAVTTIIGRTYRVEGNVYAISGGPSTILQASTSFGAGPGQGDVTSTGTYKTFVFTAAATTTYIKAVANSSANAVIECDNISVRELPGNHAFNSSGNSANFPVLSARYNLLLSTEDFSSASWTKNSVIVTANAATAPDGTNTADLIYPSTSGTGRHVNRDTTGQTAGTSFTTRVSLKSAGIGFAYVYNVQGNQLLYVNLSTGATSNVGSNITNIISIIDANGWVTLSFTSTLTVGSTASYYVGPCDASGSTQVTTNGTSGIYMWGADLRVANDALNQPAYQRVNTSTDYDTVGFKPYLRFNGTNQWLQTNSIDFTATDKMFVCAGVRKIGPGIIGEFSSTTDANNGSFHLYTAGSTSYQMLSKGTVARQVTPTASGTPSTDVATGIYNISAPSISGRINGVAGMSNIESQGTGNYGNYPLYIGARAGSSFWFNGRLYGMVVAGKLANAVEITETEKYVNGKTAAY